MAIQFLQLLNGDSFGTFNKALAHEIGLHATIFLHALIAKYEQAKKMKFLREDGGFYYLFEDAQEDTVLGEKPQKKAIQQLIELGLVDYWLEGLPQKRYFRIHEEALIALCMGQKNSTKSSQRAELNPPNGRNCTLPTGGIDYIYKNEDKNEFLVSKDPEDLQTSDQPLFFAKYLDKKICSTHDHIKKKAEATLKKWATILRRMHQRDGISWENIQKMIDFALDHSFWKSQVLSADAVRRHYDKVVAQYPNPNHPTERKKVNKNIAWKIYNSLKEANIKNELKIYEDSCYVGEKKVELSLFIPPEEFENYLLTVYGGKKNER